MAEIDNGNRDQAALQGALNHPLRAPAGVHAANHNENGGANNREQQMEEEADGTEEDPQVVGQYDSRRMALSDEERGWAVAIKQAIEADPELESLTDFFYVQIAIMDRDNVEAAVERAHRLQYFRHEYDMRTEDFESSQRILQELVLLFPGYLLSVSFNEADGSYVLVLDMSKFLAQKINSTEGAMRTFMCAKYLLMHACCPDFESIRRGMYSVSENEGFCWKTNFGINIFKTFWMDLATIYPFRIKQLKSFHTGVCVNLIMSMSRSFLPPEIYAKFQLGCVCEFRLDTLFQSPNAAEATEKMLNEAREILLMRYANEESFKL